MSVFEPALSTDRLAVAAQGPWSRHLVFQHVPAGVT